MGTLTQVDLVISTYGTAVRDATEGPSAAALVPYAIRSRPQGWADPGIRARRARRPLAETPRSS
jgi:hypothetical protein